jgi:hypothetical protein
MTYDPESCVQPRAVIAEASGDIMVRRNGDAGLFIKPKLGQRWRVPFDRCELEASVADPRLQSC